ncbi:hypothetical protein RGQ29_026554 [Quercus rubra]|uniref:Uncharacterized protein n=1 Tax=Quercus rubra TaxID=3512 RepID=A0AAN7EMN2_QUERU|nr:hypothetical protein RGQ29_026554 [Quercus rubra]
MNENVEQRPPKINLKQMDWKIKRAEIRQSVRWRNCLCLPTTHVRSFRCRHHWNSILLHGGSIGSNLFALTAK